jgi:hypothetical protein
MAQHMILTLSKLVIDVLQHRLEVLQDPGHVAELFEEHEELDQDLLVEAAETMLDAFKQGSTTITITTDEDLEILIDCIDGCTYFGTPTNSAKERQRKKAFIEFAEKLSEATGQQIIAAVH